MRSTIPTMNSKSLDGLMRKTTNNSPPVASYTLKRCNGTSAMKRTPATLLVLLFVLSMATPMVNPLLDGNASSSTSARATGVDVTVTEVSFSYTTSSDEGKYRMFSSNHPIPLNRPAELYVVDAVVDVPIFGEVTVQNLGTNPSGTIDVMLKILHNEYQQFEMINVTQQLSSLGGGASNSIGFTFTPTYSGNHSLQVTGVSTVSDDNAANNQFNRHFTVASHYFNCDDLTLWTNTNEWGVNSDTSLSLGSACHVGNGEVSTYSPSAMSVLETPVFDMSDAVSNPLRTNGISFFYTGSSQPGDELKVYVDNNAGGSTQLASIVGTVDQVFIDGANWQTFSVNNQGATSPLLPAPPSAFSPATTFRFVFNTDASGNDVGFWLDDIVIMYDQKVKPIEYAISSSGVSTLGSLPGEWGAVGVSLTNDGNISDYILPSITGLPQDWEVYFAHTTGVSINDQTGILLAPGETKTIEVKIKPDENATTGFEQMNFVGTSSQYSTVNTTLPVQFQVLPDREPFIVQPTVRPACPPGYTCPFEVEIRNIGDATDVFDLTLDSMALPNGWSVQFAWTQATSILVRPDTPVTVGLSMTVPVGATPDTVATFSLQSQSQNNSAKSHSLPIDIAASMISEAEVGMTFAQGDKDWLIDAGETKEVTFTIWNNASRQDIFSMEVLHDSSQTWVVEQPMRPDAVINPGATTTFTAKITAPATGQAGDKAPIITPQITSERSGMTIAGEAFDEIRVRTISDLSIELIETPMKLRPGTSNKVLVEITNNGNGPVEAMISAQDLPSAWTTWFTLNGENQTGSLALSAPYDLENNATVEFWILVPSEEAASEIHTIALVVDSAQGLEDLNPNDNAVTFDTITASVKIPSLVGSSSSQSATVGDTVSINSTLTNIGNAADDSIIVIATVSSSPPIPDLIAFFSTGLSSTSKAVDEATTLMLLPNQSTVLTVDLILPDDMLINTRIVVSFQVIAGLNAEMQPYELQHDALILVDQQRRIEAALSAPTTIIQPTGVGLPLFVNITSTSSQTEDVTLSAALPEQWQLVCNGVLLEQDGQNLSFSAGHVTPQLMDVPCTLHRLGGPLEGKITFSITNEDQTQSWQDGQVYMFSERTADGASVTTEVVAGGVAVFLGFVLLMVLLLRNRSPEEEMFNEQKEEPEHFIEQGTATMQGPPTTAGPPVSREPDPILNEQDGPPLPAEGLPSGWTQEQWTHYGQQYLDRTEGQA